MFPYSYYGNPGLLYSYSAFPFLNEHGRNSLENLPEDVKESLELHTGEFKSSDDINRFLHEQYLRK